MRTLKIQTWTSKFWNSFREGGRRKGREWGRMKKRKFEGLRAAILLWGIHSSKRVGAAKGKIRGFDGSKWVRKNFLRHSQTRILLSGNDWSLATHKTLRRQLQASSSSCKTENHSLRPICNSYSSPISISKLREPFSKMENLECSDRRGKGKELENIKRWWKGRNRCYGWGIEKDVTTILFLGMEG